MNEEGIRVREGSGLRRRVPRSATDAVGTMLFAVIVRKLRILLHYSMSEEEK